MTMRARLSRIARAALAIVIDLVGAFVLLAAFGSATLALAANAGRFSALLDFFAHFALAGLLVSGILTAPAVLLVRRAGRTSLIFALIGVAAWGAMVAPEVLSLRRATPPAPSSERLRVLQFNLWVGNTDVPATVRWILKQDADVVFAEETSDAGQAVVRQLAQRYPVQIDCDDPVQCTTLILLKTPPLAHGGQVSGDHSGTLAWATLAGGGRPFTVVGVHRTWPYPIGPKAPQVLRVAGDPQFDHRSLIVAGDFNSTPWSAALRGVDRHWDVTRRTRALPTFPARFFKRKPLVFPLPLLPIDHVYAGRDWQTVSVRRGPRLGSDHYPVLVDLARARSTTPSPAPSAH